MVPIENNLTRPTRAAGREDTAGWGWIRPAVQAGFLLFSILLGVEFGRFVSFLAQPAGVTEVSRPASVEAYLPISSLMSLTYLVKTGTAHRVHPAGLVIFCAVLISSITLRRGFCSWICPIGTLSEHLHKAGRRIFGRNPRLPVWPDRLLRLAKYTLLGFFLWAILPMPAEALKEFLDGPYNRMADVKMYLFFAEISATAAVVLVTFAALSLLIQNFWCRYLCPYGALLGLLARLSPLGVRRDPTRCNLCRRCDRTCPNRIQVSKTRFVASEECTACFSCVASCPIPQALRFCGPKGAPSIGAPVYAALLLLLILFVPRLFASLGYWESNTPLSVYKRLYATIHAIDHPRGPVRAQAPPAAPDTIEPPWSGRAP
jgi:polyferredoxin